MVVSGQETGRDGTTNSSPKITNTIAFYLSVDDPEKYRNLDKMLPEENRSAITEAMMQSNITLLGMRVMAEPVLQDTDFLSWNVTNHTFVITPQAAIRLDSWCRDRWLKFVLAACGEPVYIGWFDTMVDSNAKSMPVILIDHIKFDLRMGPDEIRRRDAIYAKLTNNELTVRDANNPNSESRRWVDNLLSTTNNTTNFVELQIDAGYPPPNGFGLGPDLRNDPRIAEAVKKLFGTKAR